MNVSPKQLNRRSLARRILAAFALAAFCFAPSNAFADEAEQADPTAGLDVPCLIVVDQNDPSVVLYEKNADQRCIPGSTMKIMTCILSLELCDDLDQKVTVTAQAALLKDSNSLMGVIKNEELTVRQLLYGLMLKSGNDAALLLAQTLGGDTAHFVDLMNAKAAELGMSHTHFINPSGAYKRDQFSTARDMAILTCYAMQNEQFREIVSTVRYAIDPNGVRDRTMNMINSNKLVSDPEDSRLFYAFATGVKTGSTAQGGKCLVAAASKGGASVVAVLLGVTEGGSKLDRMSTVYEDAISIMDLALTEQFVSVSAQELGLDKSISMPVSGADEASTLLRPSFATESVVLSHKQIEQILAKPDLVSCKTDVSFVAAPLAKGESCAKAVYSVNGRELFTADLFTEESVGLRSGGLDVATVATPAPTAEPDDGHTLLESIPGWILFTASGVLLAAVAVAIVFFIRKKQRSQQ